MLSLQKMELKDVNPEDGGQDGGGISNEDFGRDVLHGHRGERLFGARCDRIGGRRCEGGGSIAT